MNDAKLYKTSNILQKRDAARCLEDNIHKIKWKNKTEIIDIGCGDGSVTTEILKPYLPENYKILVGCDISEKMVQFANDNYKDKKTEFQILDIEGDVNRAMKGRFDHAFSSYALHWVKQQQKAFSNIYQLLSSNGDCLLLFLGRMPMFDIYREMSKHTKWSPWVNDVERFVSPYHDSEYPEKEIKVMMEGIGFADVHVTTQDQIYVYDKLDDMEKAVMAVNPFSIPKDLQKDFIEEYLAIVERMGLVNEDNNNNIGDKVAIRAHYTVIVAYGRKIK